MLRFLDLFSGTQSFKKALTDFFEIQKWRVDNNGIWHGYHKTKEIVQYGGIDTYSPEEQNIILDLSSKDIIEKLQYTLPEGWKPDFIWSSPVCNKFSTACAYKGGNLFFTVNKEDNTISPRTEWKDSNNRRYTVQNCDKNKEKYTSEAKFALQLHENSKAIINFFRCPFVIENPAHALSKYIYKDYIRNITNYCMYGFDYKKTTAIYSNLTFNLKKCNHKGKHPRSMSGKVQQVKSYAERSSVPKKLIIDILWRIN